MIRDMHLFNGPVTQGNLMDSWLQNHNFACKLLTNASCQECIRPLMTIHYGQNAHEIDCSHIFAIWFSKFEQVKRILQLNSNVDQLPTPTPSERESRECPLNFEWLVLDCTKIVYPLYLHLRSMTIHKNAPNIHDFQKSLTKMSFEYQCPWL